MKWSAKTTFHCITSAPLKPRERERGRERDMNDLKTLLQRLELQETHSIFKEAIFKKGKAEKRRGRDSRGKRGREREREREREKESGGLEMDEGHVSSHWVGNSEKSPWLLKKRRNQRQKNSCRGTGAEKQACPLRLCFFLSSTTVASRLARPLSTKIWEGIGDDTAQIVFIFFNVEDCAECRGLLTRRRLPCHSVCPRANYSWNVKYIYMLHDTAEHAACCVLRVAWGVSCRGCTCKDTSSKVVMQCRAECGTE